MLQWGFPHSKMKTMAFFPTEILWLGKKQPW